MNPSVRTLRRRAAAWLLAALACVAPLYAADRPPAAQAAYPNVLVILADDLGYGDVHCLNPERGKIATPNIDRLASQGMRFTDVHSSSAVCTPSRYHLLTGRYNWRTRLQRGVLTGESPPLIAADRLTVGGLLKQHGYATACIGKWHLGMDMPKPLTKGKIESGPLTRGFDYFFGISASLDMPPYAFIARWPARVKAGSRSDQPICLGDLMASCADIVGAKLPANAGEDSFSFLPELLGTGHTARDAVVHQKFITHGRSTPGAPQKNDVEVPRYP